MFKSFASFILLFAPIAVGCAPPPDYTTTSGVAVYDEYKHTNAEEVQAWIDIIGENLPDDPNRARTLAQVLDGAVLVIDTPEEVLKVCTSERAAGCSTSQSILIGWYNDCNSAGLLAHEVGHLFGYDHDRYGQGPPWYDGPFTLSVDLKVQAEVCGK